jgi:hypothetical protein
MVPHLVQSASGTTGKKGSSATSSAAKDRLKASFTGRDREAKNQFIKEIHFQDCSILRAKSI